jgi:glycosyltransferase involved in cell wall biosynthesis
VRILMAVPMYPYPIVGGLERQSHELAKALVARGHAVHAVSSRFDAAQASSELIDGVQLHRARRINSRLLRFLIAPFSLALIFLRLRGAVDIVHVHNVSWFGSFVTLLAKMLGLPVISKLPNFGEFGIPGMRQQHLGDVRVALLKWSDAVVAMSPESVAELEDIGYPSAQVLKVTNGIAVSERPKKAMAPSKSITAIYVGRLSPEKGVFDLLHAWNTVQTGTTREIRLRIVGEGPQREELQALAAALGVGETVHFLGHRDDVYGELAKADLFVLTSYAEGNSNAILEAMCSGLPVIATRVGGASIQTGEVGGRFLVAPGDRATLASCILELVENDTLRVELGRAMRARAERLFDIDQVAAIYEHAYELIVSGARQRIGQIEQGQFGRQQSGTRSCAG